MKKQRIGLAFVLVLFTMLFFSMLPGTADAASFKNSKPKIKKAQYLYDSVSIQWTKVSGAESYEIERRLMNPKTGKYGGYKH